MHKYILIYVLQRRRSHSAALGRGSADGVRRGKAAPTLPYAQPSDAAASARGTRSTHQGLGVLAEPVERAHDALARERVKRAERRRRVLRRRRACACAVRLKPPRRRRPTATYNGAFGQRKRAPPRTAHGDGRREAGDGSGANQIGKPLHKWDESPDAGPAPPGAGGAPAASAACTRRSAASCASSSASVGRRPQPTHLRRITPERIARGAVVCIGAHRPMPRSGHRHCRPAP